MAEEQPSAAQTSRFLTPSALLSMNARRGSTSSPISVEKISSDVIASSICTRSRRRTLGIHRRLPQLSGVHFAQALVALQRHRAPRLGEQPFERHPERTDGELPLPAPNHCAGKYQSLQHRTRGPDLREVAAGEKVAVDARYVRRSMLDANDGQTPRFGGGVVTRLDADGFVGDGRLQRLRARHGGFLGREVDRDAGQHRVQRRRFDQARQAVDDGLGQQVLARHRRQRFHRQRQCAGSRGSVRRRSAPPSADAASARGRP